MPNYKKFFIKFNTRLPSSTPVEQLFSLGGLIATLQRKRLSDEHFEELLLLKAKRYVLYCRQISLHRYTLYCWCTSNLSIAIIKFYKINNLQ